MNNLMNSGKLTTLIGAIGKRVASTRESIHAAAIQCIGYASIHGDIMHGVRLLENIPKQQRQALVTFFERNGNFAWDKTAKSLVFKRTFAAESFTDELVVTLTKGKSWDDYSKTPEIKSDYDVEAQFDKFIKSYENAVKAGKTIEHRELVDFVLEAKAAYSGAMQDKKNEE